MYLRPIDDKSVKQIVPIPIFVIKSVANNNKLFINVCHSEDVPAPSIPFDSNKSFQLIINNQWEIPIVTSPGRDDLDKKQQYCLVYDCIINSSTIPDILENPQLKDILVEWCIESVEIRDNLVVDRDAIKFPKLKYKGTSPVELEIRLDTGESNGEDDEDGAGGFLQMKRDLLAKEELEEDENGLKSLFPQQQNNTNKTSLIQDITTEWKPKKKIQHKRKDVNFNVKMTKICEHAMYKLKVEITSELDSSLDYSLHYEKKENNLIVKNINLIDFNEKSLTIPLPNLDINHTNIKTFFTKKDHKLIIFI